MPQTYASRRLRRAVVLLLVLVLLFGLAIYQLILSNQSQMLDEAERRLGATVTIMAEHLDQSYKAVDILFSGLRAEYQDRIDNGDIQGFAAEVTPVLARAVETLPQFNGYVITDDKGIVVSASTPVLLGVNVADREYFQMQMKAARSAYLSTPVISRGSNKRIVPLSWGLRDYEGRFVGVMAMNFVSDYFADVANDLVEGYPGARIGLYFPSGEVFATNEMDDAGQRSLQELAIERPAGQIVVERASTQLPLKLIATLPSIKVVESARVWMVLVWVAFCVVSISTGAILLAMVRALAATREARDAARQADQMKSQFIAIVSHEIRTPLTGLQGLVDLLQLESLNQRQQRYVRSIGTAANAMRSIVNDILDVEKLESGRLDLEPVPTDVNQLLSEIESLYGDKARAKGVEFVCEVSGELPLLRIDPLRVGQILRNFASNATKFTHRGRITLRAEYAAAAAAGRNGWLTLSVQDTGSGIPLEDQSHVFERFSQFHGSKDRGAEGSGLGLAICKLLAEAMGGEIGFDSEPGKGSRFWIRMPAPVAGKDELRAFEDAQPAKSANSPGLSLLVVDDVELNRTIIKDYLGQIGHRIVVAESGEKALELAAKFRFDAVLLDINLQDMTGWEVARRIRADLPAPNYDVPLIALSATSKSELTADMAEYGFMGAAEKPVDWPELLQLLARVKPMAPAESGAVSRAAKDDLADPPPPAAANEGGTWAAAMRLPVVDASVRKELVDGIGLATTEKLTGHFLDALDSFEAMASSQHAVDDDAEWRQACHDMKGMAGSLGAMRIGQLALIVCRGGWPEEQDPADSQAEIIDQVLATRHALLAMSEPQRVD
jgi:signal transduction histidine kinase/DNA-binding NarL/FixJ family response regulator